MADINPKRNRSYNLSYVESGYITDQALSADGRASVEAISLVTLPDTIFVAYDNEVLYFFLV
jgi:hypothetical protein